MEYQIELLSATVTKINAEINIKDAQGFQINQEDSSSVYEPKDQSNPTVMVRSKCSLKDPSGEQFSFSMAVDFIFKFDPIPDDWTAAISNHCRQMIHDKVRDLAVSILHSMGHNLAIGK